MKHKMFKFIPLLALASALAVPFAQAEVAKEKPVGKRTLAKYDTDKDGTLNEAEKAVWEADKAKAKAARKAKKDAEKTQGTGE